MKSGAQKREGEITSGFRCEEVKENNFIHEYDCFGIHIVQERQEATGKERKSCIINVFYFFVYLTLF